MALVINNRVRETTATTGTGAQTLAGAVDGFQTFSAGIGNDNTTYYAISLNTENEWEVGLGTLNGDSSTLTRTTVLESSNSDSAVDFSAGSKEVFCTLPSEKAVYLDASDNQVGGFSSLAADTTPQLGGDLDVNGNAIVSASDGDIAINANGTGTVTMTSNSVQGDVIPGIMPGSKANFGSNSLFVGTVAHGTLSSADANTAVGYQSLDALTSAINNTAIGSRVLSKLTEGNSNTAVGNVAGQDLTDGDDNTMVGFYAGGNISTSSDNVAIGRRALYQNQTGDFNTAVGKDSLYGESGNSHSYNTAVGGNAIKEITTGDYNISLGYTAGDNITSGSGNVVIGKADVSSATGDDQLSISDGEDGSVVWMTGASTGAVEINEVWNPSLSTTGKALVMGF